MKPVTFRAVIPGEKSGNSKQICQCNRFHYLLANSKSQVQINIRERQEGAELRKVGRIRDVAKEAGLSIATVSRVVNGTTNVSPETRARVLNACKKLDYVPNPAARALSTNKSHTIAAIIPTIEHSVFAKYIAAIEHTLDEHSYSLVMAISNADEVEELKAARKLLGMGAEAFILTGAVHSDELHEMFDRRNVPYVLSSIWDPDSRNVTIGYDNYALAARAVEYLVSYGHKNIAVLHGPLSESDRTVARRSGAADACVTDVNLHFIETELNVSGGKQGVGRLLESGKRYTAILCFSDVLALGTYFALSEAGLRVPDDISVMGFDNLDWSEHTCPPLTTINLPAKRMGYEVAAQLIDHLENSKPIQSTLLPGEIIERDSVHKI